MNYWQIVLWDGETIKVKPQNVKLVQSMMAKGEGSIITDSRTIVIKNIKDFLPTDIPVPKESKLLNGGVQEDAARAFGEIVTNPDGSVVSRAVKKSVPRRKWDTYYAANPAYRMLKDEEAFVSIGFMLPVHLIRYDLVEDCTEGEAIIVEEKR